MSWLDLTPDAADEAIRQWVRNLGEPDYRVRQILPRLWQRPVAQWAEATDLPAALRAALAEEQPLPRPTLVEREVSSDGTVKFLWALADGAPIESVLIPEDARRTLCISSQSGCAFGCVFCATGRMGFGRHLTPAEIASQVREMALRPDHRVPTNVVFMGMGEPLHNWAGVDPALTILNDPRGCGIGARHITVSTVGVVPGLRALADRPEQFRVALSLHAPEGARREAMMPIERKWPLTEVLEALGAFDRRVTFEYVMIAGRNDTARDLELLAGHARRLAAHVNLLPLHPGGDPGLQPASPGRLQAFAEGLRARGVNATVRRSRGLDINAACGQLRAAVEERGVRS